MNLVPNVHWYIYIDSACVGRVEQRVNWSRGLEQRVKHTP